MPVSVQGLFVIGLRASEAVLISLATALCQSELCRVSIRTFHPHPNPLPEGAVALQVGLFTANRGGMSGADFHKRSAPGLCGQH